MRSKTPQFVYDKYYSEFKEGTTEIKIIAI